MISAATDVTEGRSLTTLAVWNFITLCLVKCICSSCAGDYFYFFCFMQMLVMFVADFVYLSFCAVSISRTCSALPSD